MHQEILKALQWRSAIKVFDPSKKVSPEDLQLILESGRMSPSSFGIEPWKFIVVENPEVRAKIRAVGYDQTKMTDASHLIVIARYTNARKTITQDLVNRMAEVRHQNVAELEGLKQMVQGGVDARSDAELDTWIRSQTYIALGFMLETAALLGVDAGPMEGFMADKVDEVLGLQPRQLATTTILALGYRGDDPYAKLTKVRRSFDQAIEFVR